MDEWETYKYEQAKAWLKQIKDAGDRLASAEDLVRAERECADGVGAIDYAKEYVSGSRKERDLAAVVEHLNETIREYCTDVARYTSVRFEAYECLRKMDNAREARILAEHYLLGREWTVICEEPDLKYSWSGIMELRRRAILHAYDVMPHSERDPMEPAI